MPLPEITSLQFAVLAALIDGERPGRFIRERLAEHGHKKSAPAFYQFMARLEDREFVEGRYVQKSVEGQLIKERVYKVTGLGVRAHQEFRDFVHNSVPARSVLGTIGA